MCILIQANIIWLKLLLFIVKFIILEQLHKKMLGVVFFNTAVENLVLLNFKRIVKIVTLYINLVMFCYDTKFP